MDILYIVGEGFSKCEDWELRFSLRSIAKYGKNIDRVFVSGYCPSWLSDEVIKLEYKDPIDEPKNQHEKHINIMSNILNAIDNSDIGDEFLVSMDDHIYIKNVDFNNYPIYIKGIEYNLNKIYLPTKKNGKAYRDYIVDCRKMLEDMGLPCFSFTIHRNMHCYRSILNELRPTIDELIQENKMIEPFLLTLNYKYKKEPFSAILSKDIKLKNGSEWWKTEKTNVMSTYDFNINSSLYVLLHGKFPQKCKYEIKKK